MMADKHGNDSVVDPDNLPEAVIARYVTLYFAPILLIFGTLGNTMTVGIMMRKSLRHLPTSLYLAALAVADNMVLWVGLFRHWLRTVSTFDIRYHHHIFCKLQRFLLYTSLDVSAWILAAVSVERFVSICFPLLRSRFCKLEHTRKAIGVIILTMGLLNGHLFWSRGLEYIYSRPKDALPNSTSTSTLRGFPASDLTDAWISNVTFAATTATRTVVKIKQCGYPSKLARQVSKLIVPWLALLFYHCGPFVIMISCNIVIVTKILKLRRQRMNYDEKGIKNLVVKKTSKTQKQLTSLTAMFLTVSTVFLILTAPAFLNFVLDTFTKSIRLFAKTPQGHAKHELFDAVVLSLMYTNHSLNFILYVITGRSFRHEIAAIFSPVLKKIRHRCGYMNSLRENIAEAQLCRGCSRRKRTENINGGARGMSGSRKDSNCSQGGGAGVKDRRTGGAVSDTRSISEREPLIFRNLRYIDDELSSCYSTNTQTLREQLSSNCLLSDSPRSPPTCFVLQNALRTPVTSPEGVPGKEQTLAAMLTNRSSSKRHLNLPSYESLSVTTPVDETERSLGRHSTRLDAVPESNQLIVTKVHVTPSQSTISGEYDSIDLYLQPAKVQRNRYAQVSDPLNQYPSIDPFPVEPTYMISLTKDDSLFFKLIAGGFINTDADVIRVPESRV